MKYKADSLIAQANLDKEHSSFSSAEKTLTGKAEAERVFSILKAKLLKLDEWNEHSMLSTYALFDEKGQSVKSGELTAGSFVRISLKGSIKYDWVRLIDIFEAADELVLTVKPTYDPTAENIDKTIVSHFFTGESTNNFCLLKRADTIAFYVIGLNEKMNTGETKNALESVRNVGVNVGAYLGIQTGEWKKFCADFINNASKEDG